MEKSKGTGKSVVRGIHMEHSIRTTYHEVCTKCGFIYDDHTDLDTGKYEGDSHLCPECLSNWHDVGKEVITKTEKRISLAEEDFHKLTNNKMRFHAKGGD